MRRPACRHASRGGAAERWCHLGSVLDDPGEAASFRQNRAATRDGAGDRIASIILFVAGLLQIGWASSLKYTRGFTKL